MSWRTALKYEVRTRDGQKLRTLADVRAYVLKLPAGRSERQYWQHMAALLLEACESGETEGATRQLMLALLHDGTLDVTTGFTNERRRESGNTAQGHARDR